MCLFEDTLNNTMVKKLILISLGSVFVIIGTLGF